MKFFNFPNERFKKYLCIFFDIRYFKLNHDIFLGKLRNTEKKLQNYGFLARKLKNYEMVRMHGYKKRRRVLTCHVIVKRYVTKTAICRIFDIKKLNRFLSVFIILTNWSKWLTSSWKICPPISQFLNFVFQKIFKNYQYC